LRRSQLIIGVGVVLLLLGGGMAAFRGLASPAGHEEP